MDNVFEKTEYSYDEIFANLKSDCEDFKKIFSILNIDYIKNISDAKILISHLTEHSNPIREAVALKLEDLNIEYFLDEYSILQFLKGLKDINPNVSRSICTIIKNNEKLQDLIETKIINNIEILLQNITPSAKKSHAKNKEHFALYWLLEGLANCKVKNNPKVLEILNVTIKFSDYTIREKTAKILAKIPQAPSEMLKIIADDVNFYVKSYIKNKSS